MTLGSHNSLTYLKPSKWWLYPFRFMAKCQSKNIEEQYNAGSRLFDMRFTFDEFGSPKVAHGLLELKIDADGIHNILSFLEEKSKEEDIWVRVLNERDRDYDVFRMWCGLINKKYPHIKFFGGINKKDWVTLFEFGKGYPKFIDKYASWNHDVFNRGTGWYWDDLWPWIYAKFHNKKWKEFYKDYDGYLLIDFI